MVELGGMNGRAQRDDWSAVRYFKVNTGTKEKTRGNFGGARRDRTADLLHAMQALSQLSYSPFSGSVMLEPAALIVKFKTIQRVL